MEVSDRGGWSEGEQSHSKHRGCREDALINEGEVLLRMERILSCPGGGTFKYLFFWRRMDDKRKCLNDCD